MKLEFNPSTEMFFVRVPRSSTHDIRTLMLEHGLDFSDPASTASEAVLFTREPYAAAAFGEYATPAAAERLDGILSQIAASWCANADGKFAMPADKELWGFQRAGVRYALGRKNTLIADEPGLGKTMQAIVYANETQAKRVLVICPASIRIQWERRVREWTTLRWPYTVHNITNARRGVHPAAEWTVVSYDLARTEAIGRALARGTYDLLILDEAHYLKTIDSKRTRAVFGGGRSLPFDHLSGRCESILALTGTPLPNRPREAYTLARGLCFDAIDWMSEATFGERFNPVVKRTIVTAGGEEKTFVDERTGRHAELQARLRGGFMVRHLKRDVMTQLKMPVYDLVQFEETGPVQQALEAEKLLDIDPEDLTGADASILGHIAVVRHQMGLALAPQVGEYINMIIDGGEEKVVVFAWHLKVMDILEKMWQKHGVLRIDGSTSGARKGKIVDDFIDKPGHKVLLGNLQSMGTGVDGLQRVCSRGFIAEPSWVPGENIQGFDRLDRGGQERTVLGEIGVAPGSISERILASGLRKLQTTHKALDRRI